MLAYTHTYGRTDRQTDRQQTDRHTDRHTERQTMGVMCVCEQLAQGCYPAAARPGVEPARPLHQQRIGMFHDATNAHTGSSGVLADGDELVLENFRGDLEL